MSECDGQPKSEPKDRRRAMQAEKDYDTWHKKALALAKELGEAKATIERLELKVLELEDGKPAPITLDEMILCDEPGDHPHWIAPDALRLRARKLSWRTIFAGGTKPTVLRLLEDYTK